VLVIEKVNAVVLCCVLQRTWAVHATSRWSLPRKNKPLQSQLRRRRRKCRRRSWKSRRWWWGNNLTDTRTVKLPSDMCHCLGFTCFIESLSIKLAEAVRNFSLTWLHSLQHWPFAAEAKDIYNQIKDMWCIQLHGDCHWWAALLCWAATVSPLMFAHHQLCEFCKWLKIANYYGRKCFLVHSGY